jgi:hypothetical protein
VNYSHPTYFTRAHLAFRLLGLTGDKLEWMQLVTKALADYESAILYPEQLIVNAHFVKHHANEPAQLNYRVYALSFAAHAGSVGSTVSWCDFTQVKLRNEQHLQGRGSHTPATLLKWDMVGDILYPELKMDKFHHAGQPLQLGTFLPWLANGYGSKPGRGGEFKMLFANQKEAAALGARLLAMVGEREFSPPPYMGTRNLLKELAGLPPF